jgi:hypothetical protein
MNRFASRLLLRPHFESPGNISAMALVLEHPTPSRGYVLKQGETHHPVSIELPSPIQLGDETEVQDPIELYLTKLSPERKKP